MIRSTIETLEAVYTVSAGVNEPLHETTHETVHNRLETLRGLNPTQAQLADAVGVSTQAFGKSWLRWIFEVKDRRELCRSQGYTDLTITMVQSLAYHRAEGLKGREWVDQIARAEWGTPAEPARVIVEQAVSSGAIIPAAVTANTSQSQLTLRTAQQARSGMENLMDAIITGLDAESIEVEISGEMSEEMLIEMDEMRRIAKEQQIRAQVRAKFQERQQAGKAAKAQQQITDMSGGDA